MTFPKDYEKMSIEEVYRDFQRQREQGRESPAPTPLPQSPFTWTHPQHWIHHPPPLPEYVVEGLIPRRQVTLFSGHGAVGKSTVALHLCAAAALNRTWLDYPVIAGPALFLDAEDEEGVIYGRLNAICSNYGCSLSDLDQLYLMSMTKLDPVLAISNRYGKVMPQPLYDWLKDQALNLKPVLISIASSGNVFAGNENDRSQVTQFVHLLGELAGTSNGAVILIAHPSRTGLVDGSGTSGSTGWHNSVRAQMYLEGIKNGEDEDNSDLRKLEFKKNQYGKVAAGITLKWQNGMFLPVPGQTDYERAAVLARYDEAFLTVLKRSRATNRNVSDKPKSNNYAPFVFLTEPEFAGAKKIDVEAAMRRAFQQGLIKVEAYGAPSRGNERIVLA